MDLQEQTDSISLTSSAEALVSSYVQTGALVRIGDRRGQWMQRAFSMP
jgi:hypothetical protein